MTFENDRYVFSEDEVYTELVAARSAGLLSILTDRLAMDADLTMGVNGLPAIDLTYNKQKYRLAYYPVGDTDTDNFILMIRSSVKASEEDAANLMDSATFNIGATFAFAIPLAGESNIELRASIPEQGGLNTEYFYEHVLNMFFDNESELKALLAE
jgi:hypothetical protein